MLRKNKGSILINVLISMSIISTICIMCIGLVYTNNSIYNLQYKHEQLREKSLSGIEITYSNILNEVKIALENSKNREEFNNYFLENNSSDFINNIVAISNSGLDNVLVKVLSKDVYSDNEYIYLEIESNAREIRNSIQIQASIKIKNPWEAESITEEVDTETEINNEMNYNTDEIQGLDNISQNEEMIEEITNEAEIINTYKESDLVEIYNYKEL